MSWVLDLSIFLSIFVCIYMFGWLCRATCSFVSTSMFGTGWFRLNAKNNVPGNSSRRFFELDHEILHTYSGRQYLKLEEGGFLIWGFAVEISGFWPPPGQVLQPGPRITGHRDKKLKKKPLRVLDSDVQNMCAKFRGLTRRNGVRKLQNVRWSIKRSACPPKYLI